MKENKELKNPRMARYLERLEDRGLIRKSVTIPADKERQLEEMVAKWREEHLE